MIDDSVALLRSGFAELGIEFENSADILNKANEIAMRHKELRAQSTDLQNQVKPKWYFLKYDYFNNDTIYFLGLVFDAK